YYGEPWRFDPSFATDIGYLQLGLSIPLLISLLPSLVKAFWQAALCTLRQAWCLWDEDEKDKIGVYGLDRVAADVEQAATASRSLIRISEKLKGRGESIAIKKPPKGRDRGNSGIILIFIMQAPMEFYGKEKETLYMKLQEMVFPKGWTMDTILDFKIEVLLEQLQCLKRTRRSPKSREKYKSLALKARKVSSDEEVSCSESDDEEYAMAIKEDKKEKEDCRCFKCGDPNHFISDCPKHSYNDQKAFVVVCWSDSEGDSKKEETCLMALDNNEVRLKVKLETDEWIKYSGCSRHMMGNKDLFSSYKAIDGGCPIISIRTDHGQKFDNEVQFGAFCDANVITHNFSAPRTPQSNGIVERKNRTLQEMSRIMLNEQSIPQKFWCNVVDTSTYILNMILIRPFLRKTPYELFKWVFKNKLDENGVVSRNKAILVAQGYNQQKVIDFDETYALVARLESIRILLASACVHDFKLFQMDVKSDFLNDFINEEVYVAQHSALSTLENPTMSLYLKRIFMVLNKHPKLGTIDSRPFSLTICTPWAW
ncbi:retrovirus-related pol polyprotein from transposon TNT 1-94, partial [Tanacetum coccineum]